MRKYRVGICVEDTYETEDEETAIELFMQDLSWKHCYISEIEDNEADMRGDIDA